MSLSIFHLIAFLENVEHCGAGLSKQQTADLLPYSGKFSVVHIFA